MTTTTWWTWISIPLSVLSPQKSCRISSRQTSSGTSRIVWIRAYTRLAKTTRPVTHCGWIHSISHHTWLMGWTMGVLQDSWITHVSQIVDSSQFPRTTRILVSMTSPFSHFKSSPLGQSWHSTTRTKRIGPQSQMRWRTKSFKSMGICQRDVCVAQNPVVGFFLRDAKNARGSLNPQSGWPWCR